MASSDKRLTKAEVRKLHQEACREAACYPVQAGRMPLCTFCPWGK